MRFLIWSSKLHFFNLCYHWQSRIVSKYEISNNIQVSSKAVWRSKYHSLEHIKLRLCRCWCDSVGLDDTVGFGRNSTNSFRKLVSADGASLQQNVVDRSVASIIHLHHRRILSFLRCRRCRAVLRQRGPGWAKLGTWVSWWNGFQAFTVQ